MKLHRYVDHQRLHNVTKDVISLSISVLLLFRHYISHKITFGAPSSGGVLRSACGAFIEKHGDNEYHSYLGSVSMTMSEVWVVSDVYYEFMKGLNAYNGFLLVNSFFFYWETSKQYFIRSTLFAN